MLELLTMFQSAIENMRARIVAGQGVNQRPDGGPHHHSCRPSQQLLRLGSITTGHAEFNQRSDNADVSTLMLPETTSEPHGLRATDEASVAD